MGEAKQKIEGLVALLSGKLSNMEYTDHQETYNLLIKELGDIHSMLE